MKTEQEIRAAIDDLTWAVSAMSAVIPDELISGIFSEVIALQWVLSEEREGHNVAWLLDKVRGMRVRLSQPGEDTT